MFWQTEGLANPINVYDTVGYIHNLALDYALNITQGQPTDSATINTIVLQFIAARYGSSVAYLSNQQRVIDSIMRTGRTATSSQYYDTIQSIWANTALSYYTHQALIYIRDTSLPMDTIVARIKVLENQLAASTDFTDVDKTFALCQLAIARYSIAYWLSAGPEWPLVTSMGRVGGVHKLFGKGSGANKVAEDDGWGMTKGMTTGFVGGAAGGAIAGSAVPGVGTLAGAAIGGVAMSISQGIMAGIGASMNGALGGGHQDPGFWDWGGALSGLLGGAGSLGDWW